MRRFFQDYIAMTAGTAGYVLSQLLLFACLTRVSGASFGGAFAFALAVATPLFTSFNLGLRIVLATDVGLNYRWNSALIVRSCGVIGASVSTAALLHLSGPSFSPGLIMVILLIKSAESASDVAYGALQRSNDIRSQAVSLLARSLTGTSSFAVVLLTTRDPIMALSAYGGAILLVFMVSDLPKVYRYENARTAARSFQEEIQSLVLGGAPLAGAVTVNSIAINIPRYLLQEDSLAAVGVFTALNSFSMAGNLGVTALGQVLLSTMTRDFRACRFDRFDRTILASTVAVASAGVLSSLIAFFAAGPIIHVVFGPELAPYSNLLWIYVAAGVPLYISQVLSYAVSAGGARYSQAAIAVISLLLSGGAAWVLIAEWHLVGAAAAVCVLGMVRVGAHVLILKKLRTSALRSTHSS